MKRFKKSMLLAMIITVLTVGVTFVQANVSSSAGDNFQLKTVTDSPNPNFSIGIGNGAGGFSHQLITWNNMLILNGSGKAWCPSCGTTVGPDNRADMVILSNGNVGIGTTAPGYKLDVAGIINTSSNFNCSSDIRYKKNIIGIGNALQKLSLLKGVYYHWRTGKFKEKNFSKKRTLGFIAQDVEKVFPELVFTGTDGYKSMDYTKLTAVIVEALKEEHKLTANKFKQTEDKLAILKKENASLKKEIASLKKVNDRVAQLERILKGYQLGMK